MVEHGGRLPMVNLISTPPMVTNCVIMRSFIKRPNEKISAEIMYILTNLFLTGVFPDRLNHVQITPVNKAHYKMSRNNNRPISILQVFSKMLEKNHAPEINIAFVDKSNLLYVSQSCFRAKHFTYMSLLNIMEQMSAEMDSKNYPLAYSWTYLKLFTPLTATYY